MYNGRMTAVLWDFSCGLYRKTYKPEINVMVQLVQKRQTFLDVHLIAETTYETVAVKWEVFLAR